MAWVRFFPGILAVIFGVLDLSRCAWGVPRKGTTQHDTNKNPESLPLFVTFDSGIPIGSMTRAASPWISQERFVWGASLDSDRLNAWRAAAPQVSLSYYMPYSRAPAASMGFPLSFWLETHPEWVLYQCDQKTVAFWDGETAPTGSVPLDFTNPSVSEWQVLNQSVHAHTLGYNAMAIDNFGGGARQGANSGKACGVWEASGAGGKKWSPRFNQTGRTYIPSATSTATFQEESIRWLERLHQLMAQHTPGLGIVPNIAIGNVGWAHTLDAARVAAASTATLSERGFSGWGSEKVAPAELADEFFWMQQQAAAGKGYYSINEVTTANWGPDWIEWVISAFAVGQQPRSALWIGGIQGYGNWSYSTPALSAPLGTALVESPTFLGHGVWLRNYTNGVAIVNANQTASTVVELGNATWLDLFGQPVSLPQGRLALSRSTGRVFLALP